jgi:glutamate carboxypeptidase
MSETATKLNLIKDCKNQQASFLKLLKRLVEIETPPADQKSHHKLFNILQKELEALGYQTSHYPGNKSGGTLLGRPSLKSKTAFQMMLGHADTVWPKGTIQKMPFNREGNVLTGPGVYDMKAGIAMMISALSIIKNAGLEPSVQPLILINSDEETGSKDSKQIIERLAKISSRVYVLEPSLDPDGKLKTRRKGVGHYDVILKGVSSHAGIEPDKGRSAIVELSYLIQKLHSLNDPEQGVSVNVGMINGGISTNVVAPESSASVDVRVLTKKDAERLDREIRSIQPTTPGVTLEIDGGFKRPPLVKNARNRVLWNAATEIATELDFELKEGISGGGSDGSYTSVITATLDGLGAVGDGAHSPTEKVLLDETVQRTALLVRLLMLPDLTE